MKRALILACLFALPIAAVLAQPPPDSTPAPANVTATQPSGPPSGGAPGADDLPPGVFGGTPQPTTEGMPAGPPINQTAPAVQQPTATPAFELTSEVIPENELEDQADVEVDAVDISDPTPLLIRARADIDVLATEVLGGAQRPEGWSGLTTTDIDNPDFLLLTRLDLEILAGLIAGVDVRPDGWFGATASSDYAIARDIRHDLELLADVRFNGTDRPTSWNGDDPFFRCSRATQTLVRLLEINGLFSAEVDSSAADYCQQIEVAASRFAEVNLLANPMMNGTLMNPTIGSGAYVVNSDFAVGFLNRGASQRVGVIPNGTGIEPVARSYAQFSNMMLVNGEGFRVFVDFQFTDVPEDVFDALPDVETVETAAFCDADWCGG